MLGPSKYAGKGQGGRMKPWTLDITKNKNQANDLFAQIPTKVQWPVFGRSADCARPGTPPENSVPVPGCARGTHTVHQAQAATGEPNPVPVVDGSTPTEWL